MLVPIKTSVRNSENVGAMDSAIYDEDKVLDRNELERLRFANAFSGGSWDSNPENVPRGNYSFRLIPPDFYGSLGAYNRNVLVCQN